MSKYSHDFEVLFMTPSIFYCCCWEQLQWRTLTQRPPGQGHAMLEEDPSVWICLSLPMWGWPRLRHPCVAFSPTSASNWLQTNRDHDHSLFIDRLLFVLYNSPVTSYFVYAVWQRAPADWKGYIVKYLLRFISQNGLPRLSWFTKSNGKCDFVRSLSFVLEFVVLRGNRGFITSLEWRPV